MMVCIIDSGRQSEQERVKSGSIRNVVSLRVTLQCQLTAQFQELVSRSLTLSSSHFKEEFFFQQNDLQ